MVKIFILYFSHRDLKWEFVFVCQLNCLDEEFVKREQG